MATTTTATAVRYRRNANWDYIAECVEAARAERLDIIGNGDVYHWNDWYDFKAKAGCSTVMIGRGALIKPWLFREIKERRHIDISAAERFEIIQKYARYGLERWGSDQRGVDLTRRFLLEWLSFLCRYIPFGILEKPATMRQSVPHHQRYVGRNEMETLLSSRSVSEWIRITEMVLGPVNDSNFKFTPKHKASADRPSCVDGKSYILNELGEVVPAATTTTAQSGDDDDGHRRRGKTLQHGVHTANVLGKRPRP